MQSDINADLYIVSCFPTIIYLTTPAATSKRAMQHIKSFTANAFSHKCDLSYSFTTEKLWCEHCNSEYLFTLANDVYLKFKAC